MPSLDKGLEGVLVTETELSLIDGDAGELSYVGYPIGDIAENATYEEVVYLLWHGQLPTEAELAQFESVLVEERAVDDEVISSLESMAARDENPMAGLRTAVSMLSAFDEQAVNLGAATKEQADQQARSLIAKIPTLVAAFARLREGKEPVEPRDDLSHAANFLYMLNDDEPEPVTADILDTALVLHLDHGVNASTFSAIVTAATMTDLYSAVTSAIGTLKGPLHGGANQDVMKMLADIDGSDKDPTEWLDEAINQRRIPGFGHRVYQVKDPRADILGRYSERLGEESGEEQWFEISTAVERYMNERKGIAPNVDFYSASMYYQMGIPVDIFTPIFAMSRVGGWIAHVLEYTEENRLVRPRARYTGPERRSFVPLADR